MLKTIAQSAFSVPFCVQSRIASRLVLSPGCLNRSTASSNTQPSSSRLHYWSSRKTVKLPSPPELCPHRKLTQSSIIPLIYRKEHSAWRGLSSDQPHQDGLRGLQRNSLLKVVSWNIDFASPGPTERVNVAMKYLQRTFRDHPDQLAILLQEVCQSSVQQILKTSWVQQNFVVAGHEPPRIFQAGIPRPARYFTLVMTPKNLRLENAFRKPLPSEMGRDALFVDIQLRPTTRRPNSETKDVLRLCTTHLESLEEGAFLRRRQLELISQELSNDGGVTNVTAGLVGGDMNAIHDVEHTLHKQIGLKDAWEDELLIRPPSSERGKVDCSYGQISGHTWGYQSDMTRWVPNRFDKFMYTRCIETFPLSETQVSERKLGRIGIGLTADVPLKVGHGDQQQPKSDEKMGQKTWVSDHFGIAIGIKVVA